MKKVLKITESQYNRIFLLNEQKPYYLMPGQPDYPGTDMYKEIHKNDREAMEGLKSLGKVIYDGFDCSTIKPKEDEDKDEDKSWWDYFTQTGESWLEYGHCIVDNISMAVSVVPVIGTAASAIADLLNSVVYLGEARYHSLTGSYLSLTGDYEGAKKQFKKGGIAVGFAGLAALGIIPGVSEVKALGKISKNVIEKSDNILKELKKQGIKKGSKEAEDIMKVVQVTEKYSKGMSTIEKKQLGELLDLLGNPEVKEGIKNMGKFNDFTQNFMKWTGLKNYQLRSLIGSKDFNKILKNNGNDIYKALKSNETKKLISNIIAQGVSAVAMVGLTKAIESYLKTKSSKTQETYISMITDPTKVKKLEGMSENGYLQLIDSIEDFGGEMSDEEFLSMVDSIDSSDTHIIQSGENLSSIAKKYGMKWTELYDKNRDIIEKTQKKYGGVKTCNKTYCKGREKPSPIHIYKGTTLKIT